MGQGRPGRAVVRPRGIGRHGSHETSDKIISEAIGTGNPRRRAGRPRRSRDQAVETIVLRAGGGRGSEERFEQRRCGPVAKERRDLAAPQRQEIRVAGGEGGGGSFETNQAGQGRVSSASVGEVAGPAMTRRGGPAGEGVREVVASSAPRKVAPCAPAGARTPRRRGRRCPASASAPTPGRRTRAGSRSRRRDTGARTRSAKRSCCQRQRSQKKKKGGGATEEGRPFVAGLEPLSTTRSPLASSSALASAIAVAARLGDLAAPASRARGRRDPNTK